MKNKKRETLERLEERLKNHKKNIRSHGSHRTKTSEKQSPSPPKDSLKLLFIITENGYADDITRMLFDAGIKFNFVLKGMGTANSEILNLLGLGDKTRDVIMVVTESVKTTAVLEHLQETSRTNGIVFSIRMSSVGGRQILKLMQGNQGEDSNGSVNQN